MVGLGLDDPERLKLTKREDIVLTYHAAVGKWDAVDIDRVANDAQAPQHHLLLLDEFKALPAVQAMVDA
ncbi:hypothetical protein CspeluHIS016_0101710 [Cutaneotrichosporon spelunceum]|uniref:Uncharacterized protein n=1 Tax=Cutaneotrichosporon spelunceum TaxID=1672016 RepID=A0AAD3Y7E6_9TREE|nr:hypothetical protein CspeluHIS016_0101710 [Cutaneotrichosporon spelunceum]